MIPQPNPMSEPWYSVKCLFHHPTRKGEEDYLYEERITLWQAASFEEAHRLAEADARRYASEANCEFVDSTDSFHLFVEKIGHGSEVYSLLRGSNIPPEAYVTTFCTTSRDRSTPLE